MGVRVPTLCLLSLDGLNAVFSVLSRVQLQCRQCECGFICLRDEGYKGSQRDAGKRQCLITHTELLATVVEPAHLFNGYDFLFAASIHF